MKPIKFLGANSFLSKPESMDDSECGPLPVYTDGEYCLSCWAPTWRERLSIFLFGKVWVWVLSGRTQPPIAIEGQKEVIKVLRPRKFLSFRDMCEWIKKESQHS